MRLKGCDETHIAKWISDMQQLRFSPDVLRRYCFLPTDLRADLHRKYCIEVDKINVDSELRRLVRESLSCQADDSQRMEIRHIVDALLALGRETGARPSN
jgi:hypothetical protein